MPRSAFFSKDTIAAAGLEIIRRQGAEALSARALSKRLGCSLSPIFTVFKDMDEIHAAVRQAAAALFSDFMKDVLEYQPAFKEFGLRLVSFSKEEPYLFQMLFLGKESCLEIAAGIEKIVFARPIKDTSLQKSRLNSFSDRCGLSPAGLRPCA